jgi:acyl dehydratase
MPETGSPSLASSYLRALMPKRGGTSTWPALEATRDGVVVDPEHLRRYRRLCGFPAENALPLTYPHLTAFPMSMALMTGKDFPFRILGLVHIRNEISQLRPIHQAEPLDYRVWIDEAFEHEKGTAFDVGAEVCDTAGEPVWSSRSTYLRRKAERSPGPSTASPHPGAETSGAAPEPAPGAALDAPAPATWRLPADLGRRYASVSGDRNPIHLYPWTARLFGFKRQIVHGMWSAARCLAALDVGDPSPDALPPGTASPGVTSPVASSPGIRPATAPQTAATFAVDFRAPVLLPSTVVLSRVPDVGGVTEFTLAAVGSGRVHLVGGLTLL